MANSSIIRTTTAADYRAWLELWHRYCAFYKAEIPVHVTQTTWERIVAADSAVHGLIAFDADSGSALGFANYVLHPYTWSARQACYLEDLFVREDRRGLGVGRALIEELRTRGRRENWGRLYWLTAGDNTVARRLYDRFTPADDFVRYDLKLE